MRTEINIPAFTAEDFLDSSDPYELVQSMSSDPFAQRQLLAKLKAMAASVGVREFVSLWKDYKNSIVKKSGEIADNATDFPDQQLELRCGRYVCDVNGVRLVEPFGETTVCAHPIMPISRMVNVDDGSERLEIAYRKGNRWRTLIAEKATLASSSGILQLAANGVFVNSENAKALSTYLFDIEQLNYDIIPETMSVGRLGWVGGEFSPFVQNIRFDGEENYRHIFNAVKSYGSEQKWIDAMIAVRKEKTAARLALAASFASVILEPCGLLPFFVHLWGGSEYGKTVSLLIASSVWASPKLGDYTASFNSTGVGTEMLAGFLNSLPLALDELQIQSSTGARDFDRMIYTLTEGVGRTRGAKAGGIQKQRTWRNCIISCGEQPITHDASGGGAVNRVLDVEVTEKVYSDLVGLCAIMSENYGWAGKRFVDYLQSDGAFERVNQIQKDFYRELLTTDSTDKQAASASALLAADKIATELIFRDGNELTVSDMAEIMTRKSDVNVNVRALDYVYEIVGRNPNKFRPNDYGEYQGEVYGKIYDDCIYVIKSVFDREMENGGFSSASFLSWAKRNGVLVCDKDGRRTKKAQICGSLVNTVCIRVQQQNIVDGFHEIETLDNELPF